MGARKVKVEKNPICLPAGWLDKQKNTVSGAEPGMEAFLLAATR